MIGVVSHCQQSHHFCCLLLAHPLNGVHMANSGSVNASVCVCVCVHACVGVWVCVPGVRNATGDGLDYVYVCIHVQSVEGRRATCYQTAASCLLYSL